MALQMRRRGLAVNTKFIAIFVAALVLVAQPIGSVVNSAVAQAAPTLAQRIADANPGDTIDVTSDELIPSEIVVDKPLTIKSSNGSTLSATTPMEGMLGLRANNITIEGITFQGNFNIGDGQIQRALEVSSYSGLVIKDNKFLNLRQPAYINDNTGATITNNYTDQTKGWVVVSNANVTFSGNTWGTNVLDIAFIPGATNNYDDAQVVSISDTNNDAVVENQFGGIKRLSDSYVTPTTNGNSGDDGVKWNPYTSVQKGLNRIVEGGTVHVADGTYTEGGTAQGQGLLFTVKNTKLVGQSRAGTIITPLSNEYGQGLTTEGVDGASIKNLTVKASTSAFTGNSAIKAHNANGFTVENVDVIGAGRTNAAAKTTGIDINGVRNVTINNVTAKDFYKNGIAITSRQSAADIATDGVSLAGVTAENNGWAGLAFYVKNGSNADITNVTLDGFVGNNNGVSLQFSDPGSIGSVFGTTSAPLVLQNVNLTKGSGSYIANFHAADVDATSVRFDGKLGGEMNYAESVARDGAITDKKDNATYGRVLLATAPLAAPSIVAPANNSYTTNPGFDNVFTKVAGAAKYEYETTYNNGANTYQDTSDAGNYDLSGANVVRHNNGSPQATYVWRVRALDSDGNAGTWSAYSTVTVDTTAPTSTNDLAGLVNGSVSIKQTLSDNFKPASGKLRIWKLDQNGNQDNSKFYASAQINVDTNNQITYSLNTVTQLFGDGVYVAKFTSTDAAGNASVQQQNFTVDNTAPAVPVHVSPANNAFINTNDFWFDWNDVAGAVSYEMQNSQSPAVDGSGSFANVQWTGDYQQIQPTESKAHSVGANGTWYWQVRSVDAAGNKSAWTTPWKITIDMQAPAAPVLSVNASDGTVLTSGAYANKYSITANWTEASTDAVKYLYKYWNAIPGNPYDALHPYVVETTSASQSGVFNQGEGTHYMQIFAVDAAGNVSPGSNVFEVKYDATKPVVAGERVDTNTFKVTATDSALNKVVANLYKVGQSGVFKPYQTSAANSLTIDLSTLAAGDYYIKYNAIDKAGNLSTTYTYEFTIAAPVVIAPTGTPSSNTSGQVAGANTTSSSNTQQQTPGQGSGTPSSSAPADQSTASVDAAGEASTVNPEVLSAQTADDAKDSTKNTTDPNGFVADASTQNAAGFAWYWWLVIAAAVIAALWAIIAAVRRRNSEAQ